MGKIRVILILRGFLLAIGLLWHGQILAQSPINIPGLIAWYPFDGNASDQSGNGNHGVVNGATLTTDRDGQANKAYSFNGVSQGITVSDPSSQLNPTSLTTSVWIYWNGTFDTLGAVILYKGNYNTRPNMAYSTEITQSSGGKLICRSDSAGFGAGGANNPSTTLKSTSAMPINTWVHCVLTVDDGTKIAKMYVNGSLNDTKTFTGSIKQTNEQLSIGKYGYNNNYDFNGKIDDICIYNRALSASEIILLYKGTTGANSTNGFAQQQRGTPYLWQGSSTAVLRSRFNPKTGIVELTMNGIISRKGYLNLMGKNLNRRQALRNYRYR